jgi:predicted RNA-binding protein associated with RNAse of E/G family
MAWHYHQHHQPLLVLMEDPIIYTDDHPFCSIDLTCGCHEDLELISEVNAAVEQGLITPEEATLIIQGKTL